MISQPGITWIKPAVDLAGKPAPARAPGDARQDGVFVRRTPAEREAPAAMHPGGIPDGGDHLASIAGCRDTLLAHAEIWLVRLMHRADARGIAAGEGWHGRPALDEVLPAACDWWGSFSYPENVRAEALQGLERAMANARRGAALDVAHDPDDGTQGPCADQALEVEHSPAWGFYRAAIDCERYRQAVLDGSGSPELARIAAMDLTMRAGIADAEHTAS